MHASLAANQGLNIQFQLPLFRLRCLELHPQKLTLSLCQLKVQISPLLIHPGRTSDVEQIFLRA